MDGQRDMAALMMKTMGNVGGPVRNTKKTCQSCMTLFDGMT
jgi:hypothetical protein